MNEKLKSFLDNDWKAERVIESGNNWNIFAKPIDNFFVYAWAEANENGKQWGQVGIYSPNGLNNNRFVTKVLEQIRDTYKLKEPRTRDGNWLYVDFDNYDDSKETEEKYCERLAEAANKLFDML